ncbi:hypothetical protein R4Z09_13540 [Niallia oryzisoli]|uniref:Uncharacterized protein n=1 Tax=Niallia oryzisoli TaxID=1737571 RepID=A0ABZ2CS31_9BACI
MSKQYIEFILKNEEHLKRVTELQKLWEEYVDYHINDIEMTADGIYVRESKIHDTQYIGDEFKKLIEENYFFDPDCDPYYVIEDSYEQALLSNHVVEFINAIEEEQKRRHSRERQPKKMWEKLTAMGLENEGKGV